MLGMFLMFCTGVLLWLIYGFLIQSLPVILANGVALVLAGAMLALKLKHG
jgi:MtN3 and saliva related transmembrane protein